MSINKGDRVAMLLKNSVDYICTYYGILKVRGIVVPLNTGIESKEISEIIIDCYAKFLISESHFNERIKSIYKIRSIPCKFLAMIDDKNTLKNHIPAEYFNLYDIYINYAKSRPQIDLIDQDLSSIMYTSGSTGKPKGAMLTHLNIVSNTMSIVSYMNLSSIDSCIIILPFYYVYGKSLLNTHFAASGTVIIDNGFAYPNTMLINMLNENATGLAGVASTYTILLNKSSFCDMKFPALRYIAQAGGYMPTKIKEELIKYFSDKKIYIMYGATEASARISYLDIIERPDKIHSIGKAIPNVEMKIVNENGIELKYEEEGEIVVRGSNIMLGYWNDQSETEKILKDGWYYTGDLGLKDKEGFFYITGRKRDFIKCGTYKVSGIEIEETLWRYPGVQELAIIGVPDDLWGETIKAIVVPTTGTELDANDMLRFCAKSLPFYKLPKEIVFSEKLPKNEAGKVLKKKLIDLYK